LQHTNLLIQGQEDARIRDEEMHRMQQQTFDRLVVTQQRVDALLVQNYELHEYPIPRRFVILPDSYTTLDPRKVVSQRYRLYFLCECGEHCSADEDLENTASISIPVKNQVHLAKHEGYELTRPTEFYNRYGPYVLGLLRILKHCLAVTAVVAPAVSLAYNEVKDVMQGVESVTKNTMELAISSSIAFLEQHLETNDAAENIANLQQMQSGDDTMDIISDLRALEGADLRRLDTFLRNKDKDKILGNLYRIITAEGHVKWVCLQHYQASYRASAMKAFIQTVEATGGTYDPHLGKVTITFQSSTAHKAFFNDLVNQAADVTELDVALDWTFGSSDLSHLVKKIAQSNVIVLRLNLMDHATTRNVVPPGLNYIPTYRSLIKLFSNNKLQHLDLLGVYSFGNKTPSPSKDQQLSSSLRTLHFSCPIHFTDEIRLMEIISHCPSLTDLRLGRFSGSLQFFTVLEAFTSALATSLRTADPIEAISQLAHRIHNRHSRPSPARLSDLRSLHIYGPMESLVAKLVDSLPDCLSMSSMTDIVLIDVPNVHRRVQDFIRASSSILQVLILLVTASTNEPADLCVFQSTLPYSNLTHLHLGLELATSSLQQLALIIPTLRLIYFGADHRSKSLLPYVNYTSLRSLSLVGMNEVDLDPIFQAFGMECLPCQLETLTLASVGNINRLPELLRVIHLKQLYLFYLGKTALEVILPDLDLSELTLLSIVDSEYDWPTEEIIASRSQEFTDQLQIHLGRPQSKDLEVRRILSKGVFSEKAHSLQGSSTTLPRSRVRILDDSDIINNYYQSIVSSISS
jgi:hypothetical protein